MVEVDHVVVAILLSDVSLRVRSGNSVLSQQPSNTDTIGEGFGLFRGLTRQRRPIEDRFTGDPDGEDRAFKQLKGLVICVAPWLCIVIQSTRLGDLYRTRCCPARGVNFFSKSKLCFRGVRGEETEKEMINDKKRQDRATRSAQLGQQTRQTSGPTSFSLAGPSRWRRGAAGRQCVGSSVYNRSTRIPSAKCRICQASIFTRNGCKVREEGEGGGPLRRLRRASCCTQRAGPRAPS